MLAENTFEGEAETLRRLARWRIEGVALPFEPAAAELVEAVAHHEENRFGGLARSLEAGRYPDMTDLDHAVRRIEPHEGAHAGRFPRIPADEGVEPWIAACLAILNPIAEALIAGKGPIAQICPDRALGIVMGEGLVEIESMLGNRDRLKSHPAAEQRPAVGRKSGGQRIDGGSDRPLRRFSVHVRRRSGRLTP